MAAAGTELLDADEVSCSMAGGFSGRAFEVCESASGFGKR